MNEIKEYKQILIVELKDGTILKTEKTLNQLMEYYANCWDLLLIDWVVFNRFEFKKAYEEKIDWIEDFIFSLDKETQKKVRDREKEKKEKLWKWFENIQEIQNYIENNVK